MSIESSAAPSHKPVGAMSHRGGKNTGKADAPSSDASSGFSALMTMLSAADSTTDGPVVVSDGDLTATVDVSGVLVNSDQNVPIPQSGQAMQAMTLNALSGATEAPLAPVDSQLAGASGLVLDAKGGIQRGNGVASLRGTSPAALPGSLPTSVQQSLPDQLSSVLSAINLKALPGQMDAAPAQATAPMANVNAGTSEANVAAQGKRLVAPTLVSSVGSEQAATDAARRDVAAALSEAVLGVAGQAMPEQPELQPGVKGLAHAQSVSATQAELKEAKAHPATLDLASRTETSTVAFVNGVADSLLKSQERVAAKPAGSRTEEVGQGAVGGASGVNARADKPNEIEATAAAVPDTAIAETVSYWVTQGVQNAEMTLDGFGSDSVKVSISLSGDQAQIDFRTDQADVRQALEAATADLRNLLSGEGLQLTGVSVGTSSGRSTRDDAQQPNPGTRQRALVQELAAAPARSHNINASVGRSLDLYV